jgi:hypothetical protein
MLGWCRLAIARGYAFGLYGDASALGTARRAASISSPASVSSLLDAKEAHAAAVLAGGPQTPSPGELSLVLVMARDIPGDHLAHGFRNSCLARLKTREAARAKSTGGQAVAFPAPDRAAALASGQAAASCTPAPAYSAAPSAHIAVPSASEVDAVAQLSAFAGAFLGWSFTTGDEIAMVWRADGSMVTSFGGASVRSATVTHPGLIRAFFDVYAGPTPVSTRAKASFEANLSAVTALPAPTPGEIVRLVCTEHDSRTK